jgi:hypothetical protein
MRALRRGQKEDHHGESYETAAPTLLQQHQFHSLTSSALHVILEDDDDDASTRRGGIIQKSQTCSCLTALHTSTERKWTTSSLSSQDGTEDDGDWGYFSEPLPERPITPVRDPPTHFHPYTKKRTATGGWELKKERMNPRFGDYCCCLFTNIPLGIPTTD